MHFIIKYVSLEFNLLKINIKTIHHQFIDQVEAGSELELAAYRRFSDINIESGYLSTIV